jgi:hypothetical protein
MIQIILDNLILIYFIGYILAFISNIYLCLLDKDEINVGDLLWYFILSSTSFIIFIINIMLMIEEFDFKVFKKVIYKKRGKL